MPLKLMTGACAQGAVIPKLHTGEGADLSPAIEWTDPPAGTRSFAFIVDDPDAPAGMWNHWLLWDIPAGTRNLAQGFRPPQIGVSGKNDFGKPGYGGPMPPAGHGPHRYYFKLYALDVPSLGLAAGARRADLDRALRGHILSEAQCMGRYQRG